MLGDNTLQQDYIYYPWTTANGQGRLQQAKSGIPSDDDSLQKLAYTYDAVGNVLTIADYNAGGTQTQTFTYDALDRLQTAVASGGSGGTYTTKTYSYNEIGNLTNNGDGTLVYPASGPSSVRPHAVTTWGSYTYSYDANGNQTQRRVGGSPYNLTYDAENRLTTVKRGKTTVASFVYDGDGNRVKSVMGGVTTYYVGNHFERTGSTSTMFKYYYAGSQRSLS